jgi:Asp-tRNA(Asn)/Glu-tRNA(Gln) amidotransferase C subunit
MKITVKLFFVWIFTAAAIASASAQDKEITDEELARYVITMDSVAALTEQIKQVITELVTNNPAISAARYNELSRIAGDSVKLVEAKATPEEIRALKEITAKRDAETRKLQETFNKLATEYVGAATYNKIRNALRTDSALKARYEAMMAERKKGGDS